MTNQDLKNFNQHMEIVEMTPEEYKNQGENQEIHYSFADGLFGKMIIASTPKGIFYIGLVLDENFAMAELKKRLPKATFLNIAEAIHQKALLLFSGDQHQEPIKLHLKGTAFQLKVWKALLTIPMGKLVTYGDIAKQIDHPKACRAVGTAVGDNPIFFLVPCHRVIQSSGKYGNYFWGPAVKNNIIGWESTIK